MLNKIDGEAWDLIATSFKHIVANDDSDTVAENATDVAKSVFSENLLRNILDLDAGQQVELCASLAKGEKDGGISPQSLVARRNSGLA